MDGLTVAAVWALPDTIDIVDTALAIGVLAHEVNGREGELALAVVTILLVVEVDGRLLHLSDLALAVADFGHFFTHAGVVLIDALLLRLEVLQQEGFEHAEP